MREYDSAGKLARVVCNQCGRSLEVKNGVPTIDWFAADKEWGFFSDKDGQIHSFDLCEECYNQLVSGLKIAPFVREQTELV